MTGSHNVGSVNTKITLDDEEFKKKVEEMRKFTEQFTQQGVKSSEQLQASMESTSTTINNLVESTKTLKEGQDQLYGTSGKVSDNIRKEAENIKKLSQESKNAVKSVDEVTKANDKLDKALRRTRKQAQYITTDLERALTKDLHKAIDEAEKLLGGKAVGLKPIFEDLSKKYSSQFGGVDKFNEKFFASLKAMGGYYQNIKRFADKISMVDVGKKIPMNFINIENLSTAKELEENLKGVAEAQTTIASTTKKATEAKKEDIQATKQQIAVNKEIKATQVDPKKQAQFNKELYDYLSAMADPNLGMGKKGVTLKRIRKEFADFTSDVNELNTLIANAVHAINATITHFYSEDRAVFNIKNLKEPIVEVTSEVKQLTTAEKELETQTKRVSLSMQQMFTQYLNDKVGLYGQEGSKGVFAEEFKNQLRYVFGDMTPTEFDRRFAQALKDMGVKSSGKGSNEILDFGGYFKPVIEDVKELKEEIDEVNTSAKKEVEQIEKVAESTKKATENTKELTENIKQTSATIDKTTESTAKELDLFKQINLTKKQQLHLEKEIQNTMASETQSYISNLKRGRKNRGVAETDSALWTRYNGVQGRVKTFDMNKYATHMQHIFEGIIPKDLYEKMWNLFQQRFKIGNVPPFQGQGGIKENYWKQLQHYEGLHSISSLKEEIRNITSETDALTGATETIINQIGQANSQANNLASSIKQVGTAETETNTKTKELTISTEAYKAQIVGLGNAIKMYNGLNLRFKDSNKQIIKDLSRMAELNEEYIGSAPKAYNVLNKLREVGYNFGFKGADATDAHFIGSTLRAIQDMKIVAKNPSIRKFDDKDFEEILRRLIHTGRFGIPKDSEWDMKSPAKYWLKMPSKSQYAKDPYMEIPFEHEYVDMLEGDNFEKAVKNAQTKIRKLLDWLNITLVKEAKGNVRVWNDELGKYELFGSLDFSNMRDLGDTPQEYIAELNKAIEVNKVLGQEIDKTKLKTTELSYALKENVNALKQEEVQTKKTVEATKELATAQLDLSGKTKYTVKEIYDMYDQLPLKMQNAVKALSRIIEKDRKSFYPSLASEMKGDDLKYVKSILPFIDEDSLHKIMKTNTHGISAFMSPQEHKEIEKVFKDYQNKFGEWYPVGYAIKNGFDEKWGNRRTNNKVVKGLVDGKMKIISAVNENFEEYHHALKELEEMEIVSRKTGEAVKKLGKSEDKTAISSEKLTKSLAKARLQAEALKKATSKAYVSFDKLWLNNKGEFDKYQTPIKGILRSLMNYKNDIYPNGKNDKSYQMMVKDVTAWAKQVPILDLQALLAEFNKNAFDPHKGQPEGIIPQYYELGETINSLIQKYTQLHEVTGWGTYNAPLNTYEEGLRRILGLLEEVQIVVKGSVTNEELFAGINKPIKKLQEEVKETVTCLDSFVGEVPKAIEEEQKLGETAEKSAKSVSKLKEGLELIGKTSKGISKDSLKMGEVIAGSINKATGEITPFSVKLNDVNEKIKQVKVSAEATTKSTVEMGNAIKNIIKLVETEGKTFYGGTAPIGDGRIRFIDEHSVNDTKTQANLLTTMISTAKNQAEGLKGAIKGSVSELPSELIKLVNETLSPNTIKRIEEIANLTHRTFEDILINERKLVNELDEMSRETEKISERILKGVTDTANKVKESVNEIKKETKSAEEEVKKVSETFESAGKSAEKFGEKSSKSATTIKNSWRNIFQQLNDVDNKIKELYGREINSRSLRIPQIRGAYKAVTFGKEIAQSTTSLKTFDNTVIQTAKDIYKYLFTSMRNIYNENKFSEEPIPLPIENWKQALAEIKAFELRYTALMNRMYNLSRGLGRWQNQGKSSTGYGAILEDMQRNPMYEWIKVGDKWVRQFQGYQKTIEEIREGSLGRINVVGYSDYVANIAKIKEALEGTYEHSERFKQSLVGLADAIKLNNDSMTGFVGKSKEAVQALTQMAEANERYTTTGSPKELNQLIQRLEHFSSLSEKNKNSLKGVSEQARILQNSFEVITDEFRRGTLSEEAYDREIKKLIEDFQKLGTTATEEIRKLNLEGAVEHTERFKQSLVGLADAIKRNNDSLTGFVGKSEQVIKSLTQMAEANERFNSFSDTGSPKELDQLVQRLEHFSGLTERNKTALKGLSEQARILRNSFEVVTQEFKQGQLSEEAYDREVKRLTEDLKRLGTTATEEIRKLNLVEPTKLKDANNELKKGKQSLNEFGKAMNNQEKYVDNLYRGLQKARSVIISMKTILRMMGGMAVWNFAFEMVESAKETYKAKNEMESLLNQNKKIDASGIQYFNKQLDETAEKFQKINKYSLGETATSIGLEFDLNAKEMGKSLDIIAMIQSEYVRAGRTVDEAGLAVKDILQGEFMRLSRETGVGKQELIEAGWSGDNKDVMSLLNALDKVGKSRHWDDFAKKATSLNDVLTITQSRFSELGAEIGTVAEPLIVGAFNSILGAVETLKKGFEGLGGFGKHFSLALGGTVAIKGLVTGYLMLAKNMGVLEIATHGLTKSLFMNLLQLNRNDVALHGFWKTLMATISGTEASTVANIGAKKSFVARVLGVNQTIVAEQGLKHAMVENVFRLKETEEAYKKVNNITGKHINLEKASILSKEKSGIVTSKLANLELSRSQKLAYLTTNMKYAEVANLGTGKALLKTATSARVLLGAFKALSVVGIVTWFASVASWTDTVSKRMEKYNKLLQEGKQEIKDARKTYEDWNSKLEGMSESDPKYSLTSQNAKTAKANLDDLEMANTLAKSIKKNSKEVSESHDLMLKTGLNNIYDENGLNVLEKGGQEYQQMKYVAYDIAHAEEERYKFEYASLQHINEYTNRLKEAGVDEEKRVKYITEYSTKAQEVAENLKKFNEGDITAGMYYVLGRLQLMWTDLWYDEHFLNFWESLKKTWNDLQPTVNQLVKSLGDLGHVLLDFFSTSQGQIVGGAMVIGGAIAIIGYKVAPTLKKLKDFGSTLKDVLGKVKDWKRETGSDKSPTGDKEDTPSTGGTTGDVGGKGNGKFWGWDGQMGGVLKNRALSFVNNALLIAEGMALMTEAIYMLQAPMWALAETGKTFKAKETSIRAGIEGLQLIAPTFIAILVPIVALMKVMDMWGSQIMNIKTIGATAIGIALGIGLVAEAIIMLKAPLWALGALGDDYQGMEAQVRKGAEAMKAVADSLQYLAPFIPAFVGGILLGVAMFESGLIGVELTLAVVVGIAVGIGLVTEAIILLEAPLWAIGQIGKDFKDLSGVKQGAEAIKITAEAMQDVALALGALVLVDWALITHYIDSLILDAIGIDLTSLTEKDGFFDELSKFTKEFNEKVTVVPIDPTKAENLKNTANGLTSIGEAMKAVKTAMDNLPPEFKNGGNGQPALSYDMENATTAITGSATGEETSNYFDQFKKPLEELGKFINWFNNELQFPSEGINADKLATITQSAEMVSQVNDAVNKVKEVMGNIGMGNLATGFAQMTGGTAGMPSFGGIGASFNIGTAIGEFVTGKGGQGDYQSSIGGQLYEMELVLKDLATFNNNVAGIGGASGGGGGGAMQEGTSGVAQGLTDMVTAVSQAISTLESTLAQAVPNIKTNATNIGSGIREGIKTGMGDLTSLIVPPFVTALQSMKANATTYGKGVGYNLREGVKAEAKVKQVVEDEINYTIQYLDGQKQVFYDKGAMLGEAMASGLKEKGFKQQSPGLMARTTLQEMYYMSDALDEGMGMLPEKAIELGNIISTSFNPQLALGGLSVDDLSAFQSGLDTITYMANDTNMQTSTAFNNMNTTTSTTMGSMTTTVNGAFTNIDQNATISYGRIVNTTRTSLKNMQDQTTKNIGAIRTSWHGMQTALIASAEQIRSETSSKIHQLESNMASFWNKIQNPANLLAGNPMLGGHTTPRHRPTGISSHSNGRKMLSAGNPALGQKVTGISDRFKAIGSDSKIRERFAEYLQCLLNGDMCVAGGGSGWHFNWSKEIQDVFMQWHTHFGEIYDPYLRVGKFENDDFPVRGIAPIALKYIEDAISRTKYDFYYNERYSPLEAWNRGAFNCVDGANLAIAFANAFGFTGGSLQYTTWDGIGHAYAYIPGLGVIDATAIQGGYGLTASKVSYSAGSHTIPQSRPSNNNAPNNETTINIGDINVHIEGDVENAKEKGKEIGEEINNRIYDMLRRNLGTGQ